MTSSCVFILVSFRPLVIFINCYQRLAMIIILNVSDQQRFIILAAIISFVLFLTMILTTVLCCKKKKGKAVGEGGTTKSKNKTKSNTNSSIHKKKNSKPLEHVDPDKYGTLFGIEEKIHDSGRRKDRKKDEKPRVVSSSQYGTLAIADNKAMKASGRKKQNFGRPKKGKADIHDYNTLMGLDNKLKASKRR